MFTHKLASFFQVIENRKFTSIFIRAILFFSLFYSQTTMAQISIQVLSHDSSGWTVKLQQISIGYSGAYWTITPAGGGVYSEFNDASLFPDVSVTSSQYVERPAPPGEIDYVILFFNNTALSLYQGQFLETYTYENGTATDFARVSIPSPIPPPPPTIIIGSSDGFMMNGGNLYRGGADGRSIFIHGWACRTNTPQQIGVKLYINGYYHNSYPTGVLRVGTDTLCSSGLSTNGFVIEFTSAMQQAHGGGWACVNGAFNSEESNLSPNGQAPFNYCTQIPNALSRPPVGGIDNFYQTGITYENRDWFTADREQKINGFACIPAAPERQSEVFVRVLGDSDVIYNRVYTEAATSGRSWDSTVNDNTLEGGFRTYGPNDISDACGGGSRRARFQFKLTQQDLTRFQGQQLKIEVYDEPAARYIPLTNSGAWRIPVPANVVGAVEGIGTDANQNKVLYGWACYKGNDKAIDVMVYAKNFEQGNTATGDGCTGNSWPANPCRLANTNKGIPIIKGKANLLSTSHITYDSSIYTNIDASAVANSSRCGSSTGHKFAIVLSNSFLGSRIPGTTENLSDNDLYVNAINPMGGYNTQLRVELVGGTVGQGPLFLRSPAAIAESTLISSVKNNHSLTVPVVSVGSCTEHPDSLGNCPRQNLPRKKVPVPTGNRRPSW